jgi:dihydrofolate reductase
VILQEFVSLDGMVAGPNKSVDFIPRATAGDPSFEKRQMSFMDSIDAILLGKVTYEMFAGYWPNLTSGEDKPFADKLNAIPKIVFSRTLDRAPWGKFHPARIVKNDAAEEVAKLRRASGKSMVIWGSISLAQSLLRAGHIDEIEIVFCPVTLGSGRTLFDTVDPLQMKLVQTKSFDSGTVLLAYRTAS